MNLLTDFPVVLRIESPAPGDSFRDELLELLIEYGVEAIFEHDRPGVCWDVSFNEQAWPVALESDDARSSNLADVRARRMSSCC